MAGILVGYARVSTYDQQAGLDAQLRDLKSAGCEEIFSEQVSAVAQQDRTRDRLCQGGTTVSFAVETAWWSLQARQAGTEARIFCGSSKASTGAASA